MSAELSINVYQLQEIAEEVHTTQRPKTVALTADVIATLKPAKRGTRRRVRREPTAEDIAASEAAYGGWKDVDVDRFLHDNAKSRRLSRPRVDL